MHYSTVFYVFFLCVLFSYFFSINKSDFKEKSFKKLGHVWQIPRHLVPELGYLIRTFESGEELKVIEGLDIRNIQDNNEIFIYLRNFSKTGFQPNINDLKELNNLEFYSYSVQQIKNEIKKGLITNEEVEDKKKELLDNLNNGTIDKYKFKKETIKDIWDTTIGCLGLKKNSNGVFKHKGFTKRETGYDLRGLFYYPPGGFREIHTNRYHQLGWRLYFIKTLNESESSFQYINPDNSDNLEYIKVPDRNNYFNLFEIKEEELFWHSVFSGETHRFSVGLRLPDDFAKELISRL